MGKLHSTCSHLTEQNFCLLAVISNYGQSALLEELFDEFTGTILPVHHIIEVRATFSLNLESCVSALIWQPLVIHLM